jgi:Zn-finger nucleic acid-binding protein
MRAEAVVSAEIDVCDACEGLWVDWFDGEIQTLAAEAEAARIDRGSPLPHQRPVLSPAPPSVDVDAPLGACPRCTKSLFAERYRFADASGDELVADVDLLRCPECAGSFVPRSSAHLLLDRVREPRGPTVWEALVALLKRLVLRTPVE